MQVEGHEPVGQGVQSTLIAEQALELSKPGRSVLVDKQAGRMDCSIELVGAACAPEQIQIDLQHL